MNHMQYIVPPNDMSFKDIAVIVWRRKLTILVVIALSLAVAYAWTRRIPRRWRAAGQMIVVEYTPLAGGAKSQELNQILGQTAPESASTQVAMLESDVMAQRTLDWLKAHAAARKKSLAQIGFPQAQSLPADFSKLVSVNIIKETNLLEVKAVADSPDRSALLANAVCQAFVQWKKEIAQQGTKSMLVNLEVRAKRAKDQLLEAEQLEMEFKRTHNLVDVPVQERAAVEEYVTREAEATTRRQELVAQETKLKSLGDLLSTTDKSIRTGTGVRDDTLVLGLQQQLSAMEIDRGNMALKVTPEYPGMLNDLDAKIADVKTRLSEAVRATLDNKMPSLQTQGLLFDQYKQQQSLVLITKASLGAADALRHSLKRNMAWMPLAAMQYARLVNDSSLDNTQYAVLQAALNTVQFSKDMTNGNVQVTAAALPPMGPFQPDMQKNLLVGAVAGTGLALLLAFAIDHADRRVRTLQQVRRMVQEPIIGSLPLLSRRAMRGIVQGDPPPMVVEAFNMAWANLTMIKSVQEVEGPLTLLVTSAFPGEGKSTAAAQIALTLARADKRVILVDADLRRPSQGRLFPSTGSVGLVNVLNDEVALQDALVPTSTDNLRLLYSGTAVRNPTELLASPQMQAAIARLGLVADVVIIDAPPVSLVADALLLVPRVDGVLFIVGAGVVDEDALTTAIEMLNNASGNRVYLFVNRAPHERRHSYKGYYSHSARYVPFTSRTVKSSRRASLEAGKEIAENGKTPSDHEEISK